MDDNNISSNSPASEGQTPTPTVNGVTGERIKLVGGKPLINVDSSGFQRKTLTAAENPTAAETPAETAAKPTDAEPAPDDNRVRKEWLEAQKSKRRAQEMEKQARGSLDKAEALKKAREALDNGTDPTQYITEAGLDPYKFYSDWTKYQLNSTQETDPVKRELAEHKSRLERYEEQLAQQNQQLQEREILAMHNQALAQHCIPLINNNKDKYEALLRQYGKDAAATVYKTAWAIKQETGVARTFESVADEMEAYHTEQLEEGIKTALSMSKLKSKFAQLSSQTQSEKPVPSRPTETPIAAAKPTLSNKPMAITYSDQAPRTLSRPQTLSERVAAALERMDKKVL
jgi:hypothetical protein